MMERLLPRHLQIIYGINHYFLDDVNKKYPGDFDRLQRMSLVDETGERRVRMAHLSIVGSHSTNGVARLHTELLRSRLVPDFAAMFPERFNNKTNGVTPRRWLLRCNPLLSSLITEGLGSEAWVKDLYLLRRLEPLAADASFNERFRQVKHANKVALADFLNREYGFAVDPATLFDVQIKRMHEYKRQLLNALHIVHLYHTILENPDVPMVPRTFLFGGKAAPGYTMAKLIIKLINNIGRVVNSDPLVRDRLKVYFVPNYGVSLAERIFPAAELSEQISTAGMEASGTGNMKFMMNGALTIGTLDGANVEIMEAVGKENIFIFGLTADEVNELRPTYHPQDYYRADVETRQALDMIFSGNFNRDERGIFDPIRHMLLESDHYLNLADLPSYRETQNRVDELYRDPAAWTRMAITNVAHAGRFSADRTIAEYAEEIWQAQAVSVQGDAFRASDTVEQAKARLPPGQAPEVQ
jgi:starch phosphorylase